jgi:hypothetical protein
MTFIGRRKILSVYYEKPMSEWSGSPEREPLRLERRRIYLEKKKEKV